MRAPAMEFAEARHRSGPLLSGEQSSERTGVTRSAGDRSCDIEIALAISRSRLRSQGRACDPLGTTISIGWMSWVNDGIRGTCLVSLVPARRRHDQEETQPI